MLAFKIRDERSCGRVCLSTPLKVSEKLVEYLCLQYKYEEEISHAVNVYRTVSGQSRWLSVMIRLKGVQIVKQT